MSKQFDYNAPFDLEDAHNKGKKSDVQLLVICIIYLVNVAISALYVLYGHATKTSLVANIGVFVENILAMAVVVILVNKYKH